jgi:hypothetical protein
VEVNVMASTIYDGNDNLAMPEGEGRGWGWRDRVGSLFNRAKTKGLDSFSQMMGAARGGVFRGKELYGRGKKRGLDSFSSSWNKAKGLFEREEDAPEELTKMSDLEIKTREDKDAEIRYKIEKIEKKYDEKIRNESDPLEKRRLEIEKELKIRQLEEKGMSAAEKFMMGSGGEFMKGLNSTSDRDVINPNYKSFDIDSTPEEINRAKAYNKKLQGLSQRWSGPSAGIGKGLGAFAAASMGGLPGLIAGTAISKGVPMAADWLMSRSAQKHEDEDAMERKYNPMRI